MSRVISILQAKDDSNDGRKVDFVCSDSLAPRIEHDRHRRAICRVRKYDDNKMKGHASRVSAFQPAAPKLLCLIKRGEAEERATKGRRTDEYNIFWEEWG